MTFAAETLLPWLPNAPSLPIDYGQATVDAVSLAVLRAGAEVAHRRLATLGICRASDLDMLCRCAMGALQREACVVASFDGEYRLLGLDLVGIGSVSVVYTEPQALVAPAVLRDARFAVVAHNHPNDDATPSSGDVETCKTEWRHFAAISVGLLDWLVVTRHGVTSLRETGVLPGAKKTEGGGNADNKRGERAARLDVGAMLSDADRAAYAAADNVLAALAAYPPALPGTWAMGAFRGWLRGQSFALAGLALDTRGRPIAREILIGSDGELTQALPACCRFAVRTFGYRFAFAARGVLDGDLRVQVCAVSEVLAALGLQLLDFLHVEGADDVTSLRECGLLDSRPEIK